MAPGPRHQATKDDTKALAVCASLQSIRRFADIGTVLERRCWKNT